MCQECRDKPAMSLPPGTSLEGQVLPQATLRGRVGAGLRPTSGGAAPHACPRACWWLAQRECQFFLLGEGPAQGKVPPRLSLPEWLSHATVFL